MPGQATVQPSATGYAGRRITKPPEWHGLVAWDLLLNNLTTGLFLVAALGELTLPQIFMPVAKIAYPIALVLLLADLVCLVLDLGDPLRFHHMLRVLKPTSPMSLGTWCLTVYSIPLSVAVVLDLLPVESPAVAWTRKIAVILALLPALGSALYKGVLLSTNAQPGWRDARWLGGYLPNSAILLGCALMLALATLLEQTRAAGILRIAVAVLLLINLLPLYLLAAELGPILSRIYTRGELGLLAALGVGGGMLLPLVLLLAWSGLGPVLAAVLLLLLGNLVLRFVIVWIPHQGT